jgi:hypothetical protein
VEDAAKEKGIYEQLHRAKDDEKKKAEILGTWARQKFNMTACLNENVEVEKDKSPCKMRFCQTASKEFDQTLLCNFCQMHSCSDYCLRGTSVKKKNNNDVLPSDNATQKVSTHFHELILE